MEPTCHRPCRQVLCAHWKSGEALPCRSTSGYNTPMSKAAAALSKHPRVIGKELVALPATVSCRAAPPCRSYGASMWSLATVTTTLLSVLGLRSLSCRSSVIRRAHMSSNYNCPLPLTLQVLTYSSSIYTASAHRWLPPSFVSVPNAARWSSRIGRLRASRASHSHASSRPSSPWSPDHPPLSSLRA
jgi:hypothetical protein